MLRQCSWRWLEPELFAFAFVGAIEIATSVLLIHKGMLPFDASYCPDTGLEAVVAWNALQSECLSLCGVSTKQSSEIRCRGWTPVEGVRCGQQSLLL